jgi:hypothetical protein
MPLRSRNNAGLGSVLQESCLLDPDSVAGQHFSPLSPPRPQLWQNLLLPILAPLLLPPGGTPRLTCWLSSFITKTHLGSFKVYGFAEDWYLLNKPHY